MQTSLLAALASSVLTIGCMASGQVHGSARLSAPSMVYISSNVQVVEDYREPVFYTDSFYWRYNGGVWYRSSQHTGGWVRYSVVPVQITRIERPAAYVHYRGSVRANGNATPAFAQQQRQEAKEERKEAKQEQQQERKEAKQEQQQERKEAKQEQQQERRDNNKGGKK